MDDLLGFAGFHKWGDPKIDGFCYHSWLEISGKQYEDKQSAWLESMQLSFWAPQQSNMRNHCCTKPYALPSNAGGYQFNRNDPLISFEPGSFTVHFKNKWLFGMSTGLSRLSQSFTFHEHPPPGWWDGGRPWPGCQACRKALLGHRIHVSTLGGSSHVVSKFPGDHPSPSWSFHVLMGYKPTSKQLLATATRMILQV